MSKEFCTERFKKIISFARGITMVSFYGSIFFGSLFILAGIVVLFLDKDLFTITEGMRSFTFDFNSSIEINLADLIDGEINVKPAIIATCFLIPIILGTFTLIVKQLSDILTSLKHNTPFTKENVKSLKVISWAVIVSSVLFPTIESTIYWVLIYTTGIEQIDSVFSIDLGTLFVGLLLLILTHIFNYGVYLQNEYDQTL